MWYRIYSNKIIDYIPNQVVGRYGTSDEIIPVGAGQHVEKQWPVACLAPSIMLFWGPSQ